MLFKIIYFLLWLPIKILQPVKKIGKENLIKGKAILCCNHQSNLDFLTIIFSAKTKVFTLCKKELTNTKFKAWFMKKMRTIPINRAKPELSSIKKCFEVLNNNHNLLVFPQGTRTTEEDIKGVKEGVALFALKSKAPIIPMVYLKKNKPFRRNTLVIGKPIYFDLEKTPENMQKVITTLELEMNNLLKAHKEK